MYTVDIGLNSFHFMRKEHIIQTFIKTDTFRVSKLLWFFDDIVQHFQFRSYLRKDDMQ